MILPTLAVAVAVYPVLAFILFASRDLVPREINLVQLQRSLSEPDSSSVTEAHRRHAPSELNDKNGAIFGSVLLGITLGVLIGTSPLKIPVYQVTVPPAVIMLARDIWHDREKWKKRHLTRRPEDVEARRSNLSNAVEPDSTSRSDASSAVSNETQNEKSRWTPLSYIQNVKEKLPTVMSIIPRLPLSLVLFAFCMFMLIQALTTWGWVEVFAGWWAAWIRACLRNGVGSATVGAISGMLVISILLCNVSILLVLTNAFPYYVNLLLSL